MKRVPKRSIACVLSLMFAVQTLLFGDGTSQGILHPATVASAAERIKKIKQEKQLAEAFEDTVKDSGHVDYFTFSLPQKTDANGENGDTEFVWDGTAGSIIEKIKEDSGITGTDTLTVTGIVRKGVVPGIAANDNEPIYVRIFNGNWEEIASQEIENGGEYAVAAAGSDVYHVKYECNGYLPFYLKDFGAGAYQIGGSESKDTVTLIPGDTTFNAAIGNQWSDDVLNAKDLEYAESCLGAYRGDSGFNPTMDADGDGVISQADLDEFCAFYEELSDGAYYDLTGSGIEQYDCDGNGVINRYDYWIRQLDESAAEEELQDFADIVSSARQADTYAFLYNHDYSHDNFVSEEDYAFGLETINEQRLLRERSENYEEYMDKNADGLIDEEDVSWFEEALGSYGETDWEHAFRRSITMLADGYFPHTLNLRDTSLDLNGCALYAGDCLSFTTDTPEFYESGGAVLDINGGCLLVENNFVFRTDSYEPERPTGQFLDLNGGTVLIGNEFDFGQIDCYDTIEMTNENDLLMIGGDWRYITEQDMEGKWTNGEIWFLGAEWAVDEQSGAKSVYSSGNHTIILGYGGGRQTVFWDDPVPYIDSEDGSFATERRLNFSE